MLAPEKVVDKRHQSMKLKALNTALEHACLGNNMR